VRLGYCNKISYIFAARKEDISLDLRDEYNLLPVAEMPSDFFDDLKIEDLVQIEYENDILHDPNIPDIEIQSNIASHISSQNEIANLHIQINRQKKRKAEKIDEETEISNAVMFKILQNTTDLICERKLSVGIFLLKMAFLILKLLRIFAKIRN
jgi:hypothetical protein